MLSMNISYRPDNYPEWVDWQDFNQQQFVLIGKPGLLGTGGVPSARAGFAPRVSLIKPSDACDPTTSRSLRRGYEFQIRFQGVGHVVVDRFRLHAQTLIERSRA